MAVKNYRRVTLSLAPHVADYLDDISSRLGISRSALASDVLSEALSPIRDLLSALPDDIAGSSPGDVARRMRGSSAPLIQERLDLLRGVLNSIEDADSFELTPCDDRPAGCSCDYSTGERVAPAGGCLVHRSKRG